MLTMMMLMSSPMAPWRRAPQAEAEEQGWTSNNAANMEVSVGARVMVLNGRRKAQG